MVLSSLSSGGNWGLRGRVTYPSKRWTWIHLVLIAVEINKSLFSEHSLCATHRVTDDGGITEIS